MPDTPIIRATSPIPVQTIKIVNRARSDLGDIQALADSIAKLGLLQPVIVDPEHILICGHRRLEACRLLCWETIDARIAETANDTLDALLMERDENYQRKPFTPSEAIAMKKLVEGKFKAEAAERRNQAGSQNLPGNGKCASSAQLSGTSTQHEKRESRERIAEAIGMSRASMERAERAVKHGVPELVEAMDKGEVSLIKAATIAKLPPEEQRQALTEATQPAASPKRAKRQTPVETTKNLDHPEAPTSARVICFQIKHDLKKIRLADPLALRELETVLAETASLIERVKAHLSKQETAQ